MVTREGDSSHVWYPGGKGVGPMSGIWGGGCTSMFQCIMGNCHMGTPPVNRMTDGQTPVKTLPSHKRSFQAVNMCGPLNSRDISNDILYDNQIS